MIKWIKFSEKQPEEQGYYLWVSGNVYQIFWWNPENKSWRCGSETPVSETPDYWAWINAPRDWSWVSVGEMSDMIELLKTLLSNMDTLFLSPNEKATLFDLLTRTQHHLKSYVRPPMPK